MARGKAESVPSRSQPGNRVRVKHGVRDLEIPLGLLVSVRERIRANLEAEPSTEGHAKRQKAASSRGETGRLSQPNPSGKNGLDNRVAIAWSFNVYIPASFAETETVRLHEFIRRNSFAILTSDGQVGLIASHLPLILDDDAGPNGHLLGHMARANPQWRDVRGEALAIFSGPHAYISPSWYEEEGTVPTWNYVAVHAYGTFHVVEERDGLLDILRRSVQTYESPRPEPWPFDESAPHVETMLRAIVGFRIEITRLEGKWKLSQNHSKERRNRVIQALEVQSTEDSRTIAGLMREGLR